MNLGNHKDQLIGEGVKFQRIRRITGYLVGSVERFNDAKRAEERERVKHAVTGQRVSFDRSLKIV